MQVKKSLTDNNRRCLCVYRSDVRKRSKLKSNRYIKKNL